jgi:glycosyltransferase involved in cell wall biosynthesis
VKLSLLTPTFNSAGTIERTLRSAVEQRWRPLEIVVYDETSRDGTREIAARLLAEARGRGIETRLLTAETNSGPVRAWRVPLHASSGDWCSFVWADDVLEPGYSEAMAEGAIRARSAGRKLVFSGAVIEDGSGSVVDKYAPDAGILSPVEFSFGIFCRRYSVNQINGVYDSAEARLVFDRHIEVENPLGFDFNRFPYGNDVGFLSELAESGGGVEILGEKLVRLVASPASMTRDAMSRRLWQFRWQYTWNLFRVWSAWENRGRAGARSLREFGARRLALCEAFLPGAGRRRNPAGLLRAARAAADFLAWDWERTRMPFDTYRRRVEERFGAR